MVRAQAPDAYRRPGASVVALPFAKAGVRLATRLNSCIGLGH